MSTVTQETARSAATEAQRLQREAARAIEDAAARRQAAEVAAKVAEQAAKGWERNRDASRQAAASELRELRKQVERELGADQDLARPSIEARVLARRVLRDPDPNLFSLLERLGALDSTWGRLNGLQQSAQGFSSRNAHLADATLNDGGDDLEILCHKAVLARLRWLAGEAA